MARNGVYRYDIRGPDCGSKRMRRGMGLTAAGRLTAVATAEAEKDGNRRGDFAVGYRSEDAFLRLYDRLAL